MAVPAFAHGAAAALEPVCELRSGAFQHRDESEQKACCEGEHRRKEEDNGIERDLFEARER